MIQVPANIRVKRKISPKKIVSRATLVSFIWRVSMRFVSRDFPTDEAKSKGEGNRKSNWERSKWSNEWTEGESDEGQRVSAFPWNVVCAASSNGCDPLKWPARERSVTTRKNKQMESIEKKRRIALCFDFICMEWRWRKAAHQLTILFAHLFIIVTDTRESFIDFMIIRDAFAIEFVVSVLNKDETSRLKSKSVR